MYILFDPNYNRIIEDRIILFFIFNNTTTEKFKTSENYSEISLQNILKIKNINL